ncbi:MAG: signal peptidase I [Anaerolineaceae bacterium]
MDKRPNDEPGTGLNGLSDEQTNEVPAIQPDGKQPSARENQWSTRAIVLETLQTVVLALILYFLIDAVVGRVRIDNISMEPTLVAGEFLLVDRVVYKFTGLETGDVVVFHFPQNPKEDYIKRVIGLEGDTVRIEDGEVYVNDIRLIEPYLASTITYEGEWVVPDDSLFVLGDNRNPSYDSHDWGFVPMENMIGRAICVYWPINKIKLLSQPQIVQAAVEE